MVECSSYFERKAFVWKELVRYLHRFQIHWCVQTAFVDRIYYLFCEMSPQIFKFTNMCRQNMLAVLWDVSTDLCRQTDVLTEYTTFLWDVCTDFHIFWCVDKYVDIIYYLSCEMSQQTFRFTNVCRIYTNVYI